MKKRVKFKYCTGLALIFFAFDCLCQLHLESLKKENQVIVKWSSNIPDERIVGYQISIMEGILSREKFPNKVVDTLSSQAKGWKSTKRKSMNFLGLELRHYSQWTDLKVITKGDIYTIGVKLIYRDSLTDKKTHIKGKLVIFPYEIFSKDSLNLTGEYLAINPTKYGILSKPLRSLMARDSNRVLINVGKEKLPVLEIYDFKEHTVLITSENAISYEKPPNRPFPLGEVKTILRTLGLVIGGFLIAIILVLIFFLLKALGILNTLYKNPTNAKDILLEFLQNDRFAVYSILFAERIVSLNILNRIVSLITARFLKIELTSNRLEVFNIIYPVYKSNNALEVDKIKRDLMATLKSV